MADIGPFGQDRKLYYRVVKVDHGSPGLGCDYFGMAWRYAQGPKLPAVAFCTLPVGDYATARAELVNAAVKAGFTPESLAWFDGEWLMTEPATQKAG